MNGLFKNILNNLNLYKLFDIIVWKIILWGYMSLIKFLQKTGSCLSSNLGSIKKAIGELSNARQVKNCEDSFADKTKALWNRYKPQFTYSNFTETETVWEADEAQNPYEKALDLQNTSSSGEKLIHAWRAYIKSNIPQLNRSEVDEVESEVVWEADVAAQDSYETHLDLKHSLSTGDKIMHIWHTYIKPNVPVRNHSIESFETETFEAVSFDNVQPNDTDALDPQNDAQKRSLSWQDYYLNMRNNFLVHLSKV